MLGEGDSINIDRYGKFKQLLLEHWSGGISELLRVTNALSTGWVEEGGDTQGEINAGTILFCLLQTQPSCAGR